MNTIKTTIHAYRYDTTIPEEQNAYCLLEKTLKQQGLKCFETWGGGASHYLPELNNMTITLETKHLFENQWNTAPIDKYSQGLRVFDWAQDYPINFRSSIKRGHYLTQTEEMRNARNERVVCQYCGAQYIRISAPAFCTKCLGSEYLKEENLPLLRLTRIGLTKHVQPLTTEEKAELLPRYIEAQLYNNKARDLNRLAQERKDIENIIPKATQKAKELIESANIEMNGKLWLLDRNMRTRNVIYYAHTKTFCFGWRQPIEEPVKSQLLELLKTFPYPYEFEKEKGRR